MSTSTNKRPRPDITAQHFAAAVLMPAYYDQIYQGRYEPVPYCKLTRRAWSVDDAKQCLVFDPQNGQEKQYVAASEQRPESWANFCTAHRKGLNPMFRHFADTYLREKTALTVPFIQTWSRATQNDESVSYQSLKAWFLTGEQRMDSSEQNDMFVNDWLHNMQGVKESVLYSGDDADDVNLAYPFTEVFIRTTLLESFVTFVYLYEPWLYMESGQSTNLKNYGDAWARYYGFRPPVVFESFLMNRFGKLPYVLGSDKKLRLPFKKPFGFAEKIVFSSQQNGKLKIDFEAKLTLCGSTLVRRQFINELVEEENSEDDEEFEDEKVYPMHFALKHFDENNVQSNVESMFFYTTISEWIVLINRIELVETVSWALSASGAEEAIDVARFNIVLNQDQTELDRVDRIVENWRLGIKKEQQWITEPYSWPSNVLPIYDEKNKQSLLFLKGQNGEDTKQLNVLNPGDTFVKYEDTPQWPYHCVYGTSDGVRDYLLAKYAVIERIVTMPTNDVLTGEQRLRNYLVSHGPVENQAYMLKHRPYLFEKEEPLLPLILFELYTLQILDNPSVLRETRYSYVDQTVLTMNYEFEADKPFLTSEDMDSDDISGNQFTYTHQLFDGLFPFVLDNTKITSAEVNNTITDEQMGDLVAELEELNSRMDIEGEEEQKEDLQRFIVSRIEALRDVERTVRRKCTSDWDQGEHYYYNVPLQCVGDDVKVRISGDNMKHWVLGRHTSCVFDLFDSIDINNCAVTRSTMYEIFNELFGAKSTQRSELAYYKQVRQQPGWDGTLLRARDFNFPNVRIRFHDYENDCTLPGMYKHGGYGDEEDEADEKYAAIAIDAVKHKIDLRYFPRIRIIGPPRMFQAPGMWGFVHSFLRFPTVPEAAAMLIKDKDTNDSCVLLSFADMKYIFVPQNDVRGDKFNLREIRPHEQNDYDVLRLIRQSGGFRDVLRAPGSNRFFMRAFTTAQNSTNYEPVATEKVASDQYYASHDGRHSMAHTFYDGSTAGSKSECIGRFVRRPPSVSSSPKTSSSKSGMDGTAMSSIISRRLALIHTPGGGRATHGVNGTWECWYCRQRRETVAHVDAREGGSFSFNAIHNLPM